MKSGWYQPLALGPKIEQIKKLAHLNGKRYRRIKELGIPTSTNYSWQCRYRAEGGDGLASEKKTPAYIWNQLSRAEEEI